MTERTYHSFSRYVWGDLDGRSQRVSESKEPTVNTNKRAFAYRNIRTRKVEIMVHQADASGAHTLQYGEPSWVPNHDDGMVLPTVQFDIEDMEEIFNDLWLQGVRPENWQESPPLVGTDQIAEYERRINRYQKDIGRERERLHHAEQRLDRALAIIEMGPSYKGRLRLKAGNGNEEDEKTT